jgi:hypothetical protein
MNNCVIYSVKWNDIDNISRYKGILYAMGFKNRNFDIIINCDTKSHEIINKIIKQEKWDHLLENVYFNIRSNMINHNIWSIKSFLENYDKYDCFGFYNSHYELGEDFFTTIQNYKYGLYTRVNYLDNKICFCHNLNYIDIDLFFINKKYLKTDIQKLNHIIDQLVELDCDLYNQFNYMYNFLFCMDFYTNNCLYLNNIQLNSNYNKKYNFYENTLPYIEYNDTKWYWYYYDLKKSSYYNVLNNTYIIDNKLYLAKDGEILNYEAVFYRDPEYSVREYDD